MRPTRLHRLAAGTALFFLFFVVPAALAQESFRPTLSVDIPTVKFSQIQVQQSNASQGISGYIDVPWIAEYVMGVYRYGIAISGIVAGVIIVIGGFQYMTGKPAEGKEKIQRTLTGVVLVLGSYVMLRTINSDLTSFKALRIATVARANFEEQLTKTEVDTSVDATSSSSASLPPPPSPSSSPSPLPNSTYTPQFSSCPYSASSGDAKAGRAEFYKQVKTGGFIKGTTPRDRVAQIAEVAALCKVQLGSCGQTAGTIQSLAGVTGSACYDPQGDLKAGPCIGEHGPTTHQISATQRRSTYAIRCEAVENNPKWSDYKRDDCVRDSKSARKIVIEQMKKEVADGKLNGWPDQWANDLKYGDYVVIYTGNTDLTGYHAVTFMGWTAKGEMLTVQGNFGKETKVSPYCVRSECGDRMSPIMYTYSAGK